jgi:hypothetical protein
MEIYGDYFSAGVHVDRRVQVILTICMMLWESTAYPNITSVRVLYIPSNVYLFSSNVTRAHSGLLLLDSVLV